MAEEGGRSGDASADGEPVFNIGYDIYKGSAALQATPIYPQVERTTGQNGREYTRIQRKGALLLEAASGSNRTYNWANKIRLALGVTELARIFLTNEVTPQNPVTIVHDPGMQSSSQGQVIRTLTVSILPDGNLGFALTEKIGEDQQRSVKLPVSYAEYVVMRQMVTFLIPRFLGMQ